MPKRPKSHQIADTAVTRVSRVFHAAGFVCERNIGDYGEDLIVQPIHQDVVDPFKMYVQVKALGKGTRGGARSRSNFTRTFPRDHIRKWIRSPELVIVAFWLERSDVIYFAVPARQWTEWRLHEFPRSAIPIVIRIQDVLTTESAVQ